MGVEVCFLVPPFTYSPLFEPRRFFPMSMPNSLELTLGRKFPTGAQIYGPWGGEIELSWVKTLPLFGGPDSPDPLAQALNHSLSLLTTVQCSRHCAFKPSQPSPRPPSAQSALSEEGAAENPQPAQPFHTPCSPPGVCAL